MRELLGRVWADRRVLLLILLLGLVTAALYPLVVAVWHGLGDAVG